MLTIENKTSTTLKILGEDLKPQLLLPNEIRQFFSRLNGFTSVHSKIGSCIITSDYGKIDTELFGEGKLSVSKVDGKIIFYG